ILVENEALSVGRAQRAELSVTAAREIVPSARVSDGFIIGNRPYLLGMAPGAIEAYGRSPVVRDQRDVPGELQRVEPRIHVACVVDKAVGLGRRLAGPTHSRKIGRQTPAIRTYVRNDIAPLIRPGWIAVQKDDGLTLSHIDIADLGIEDLHSTPRQVVWVSVPKIDSAIMVMKSAKDGRRYDAASVVDGAMDRSVLVEGSMSPQLVIIGGILRQNPA